MQQFIDIHDGMILFLAIQSESLVFAVILFEIAATETLEIDRPKMTEM